VAKQSSPAAGTSLSRGLGILSVANASAAAAGRAVAKIAQATEKALTDKIDDVLSTTFSRTLIAREYVVRGRSGGERRFDFAVRHDDEFELLINAVAPHKGSVNSKYVAFADTEADISRKFAVFDRQLDTDDVSLFQQVSLIVPFNALRQGATRAMQQAS
jgi:hypothetical protein